MHGEDIPLGACSNKLPLLTPRSTTTTLSTPTTTVILTLTLALTQTRQDPVVFTQSVFDDKSHPPMSLYRLQHIKNCSQQRILRANIFVGKSKATTSPWIFTPWHVSHEIVMPTLKYSASAMFVILPPTGNEISPKWWCAVLIFVKHFHTSEW